MKAERIPQTQIYMLMLGMTLAGSGSTIGQKLQNSQSILDDNGEKVYYKHPFFQTFGMFTGEFICLPLFYFLHQREIKKYGSKERIPNYINAEKTGLKMECNKTLLIIPAFFDLCGSTLLFISLTMLNASVYQMLKGALVFIAAVYSIIFLRRRFYRHHWTALCTVTIGVIIVGASPIVFPDDNDNSNSKDSTIYGIVLEIIALLFIGANWIAEEKLFSIYYLDPIQVVGWEGLWGTAMYTVLLIIFQFTPGDTKDIGLYGTVEDVPQAFKEFGRNNWMWILGFAVILWTALFNIFNVAVTKFASAAQRSTVDTCRTALIWLFFIIYTGDGHERFIWLELLGFMLLIGGTLIHTEAIVFPGLGFGDNTRAAIEKREKEVNSTDKDDPNASLLADQGERAATSDKSR